MPKKVIPSTTSVSLESEMIFGPQMADEQATPFVKDWMISSQSMVCHVVLSQIHWEKPNPI